AEPFTALAQLQQEGLIKHLGLSTVSAEQIAEAQSVAPIVCVQTSTTWRSGPTTT
ncbi:MAG: pyridoxine 4-dehydrogenase, partial [Acidimicrobiaceae bacterium]|nr:pyridoxine 4-dehydrogenase [Acidimicrobiaceae bacterium]